MSWGLLVVLLARAAAIDAGDRVALLSVLESLAGADSEAYADVAEAADPCSDAVVDFLQCDDDGRVAELSLIGQAWGGHLAAAIGNLTGLTGFDVVGCSLQGSIPTEIWTLPQLVEVDLSDNQLTGSLPAAVPPLLSSLLLSSNPSLTGTLGVDVWNSTTLQVLKAFQTNLSGTIPALPANLAELDIRETLLHGSLPDVFLPSLELLWVGDNALSGSIPPRLLESVYESAYSAIFHFNHFSGELPGPGPGAAATFSRGIFTSFNNFTGAAPSMACARYYITEASGFTGAYPNPILEPGDGCEVHAYDVSTNPGLAGPLPDFVLDIAPWVTILRFAETGLNGTLPDWFTVDNFASFQGSAALALHRTDIDCALPSGFECFYRSASSVVEVGACGDEVLELTVLQVVGGAVQVEWEAVVDNPDVTGFRVDAWRADGVYCDTRQSCFAAANETSCWVTQLDSEAEYSVQLGVVYESIGLGINWLDPDQHWIRDIVIKEFATESIVPDVPQEFRVEDKSASAVTVAWEPLQGYNATRGHVITYTATAAPGAASCASSSSSSFCTMDGLEPDTRYTITLEAQSAPGFVSVADAVVVTTCDENSRQVDLECHYCYSNPGCSGAATCDFGFEGELCGVCPSGEYRFLNQCAACAGAPVEAVAALFVFVVGAVVVVRMRQRAALTLLIVVALADAMQLVSLALSYTARFTAEAATAGLFGGLFMVDIGALHPECFVPGWNWHWVFFIGAGLVPLELALPVLGSTFLASRTPKVASKKSKKAVVEVQMVAFSLADESDNKDEPSGSETGAKRRRVLQICVTLAVLYAVPLLQLLAATFECVSGPGDTSLLFVDQSIDCRSDSHRLVQGAALLWFASLFFGLAFLYRKLRGFQRDHKLNDSAVAAVFGGLYEDFSDQFASFQVVALARKAAMVMVDKLLVGLPLAQAFLGLGLTAAYLFVLARYRPYVAHKRRLRPTAFPAGRLREWAKHVGFVDITNGIFIASAAVVLAFQVFTLVVIVGDVRDTAQNVLLLFPTLCLLAFLVLVAMSLRSELRRGFHTPQLRLSGDELLEELRFVEAAMLELAGRRKYLYAHELHVTLQVMRRRADVLDEPGVSCAKMDAALVDFHSASDDDGDPLAAAATLTKRLKECELEFSEAQQYLLAHECAELDAAELLRAQMATDAAAEQDALQALLLLDQPAEEALAKHRAAQAARAATLQELGDSGGAPGERRLRHLLSDTRYGARYYRRCRVARLAVPWAAGALLCALAAVVAAVLLSGEGAAAASAPDLGDSCYAHDWGDTCSSWATPVGPGPLFEHDEIDAVTTVQDSADLALQLFVALGATTAYQSTYGSMDGYDLCEGAMMTTLCTLVLYPCNATCEVPEVVAYDVICPPLIDTCGDEVLAAVVYNWPSVRDYLDVHAGGLAYQGDTWVASFDSCLGNFQGLDMDTEGEVSFCS